eukprot:TRINITY_DN5869_c0_g1_i1.p1 TRINITY_DN5869_c0_g1~~TRINITY_DN5869_c0_g1_i1.p1  ORF type:complete len:156 (+),score=11.68 TRINITY_DN5869_c0_g1_i1:291-758(+)
MGRVSNNGRWKSIRVRRRLCWIHNPTSFKKTVYRVLVFLFDPFDSLIIDALNTLYPSHEISYPSLHPIQKNPPSHVFDASHVGEANFLWSLVLENLCWSDRICGGNNIRKMEVLVNLSGHMSYMEGMMTGDVVHLIFAHYFGIVDGLVDNIEKNA